MTPHPTYTHVMTHGFVHYTRVKPLDRETVRLSLSVVVPEYRTKYSDPLIALYVATAVTETAKKSKKQIESYMRKHGISLSVSVTADVVHFNLVVRHANFTYALALLREVIYERKVSEAEFSQKRSLELEGNREARDDAKRIASIHFVNTLYGSHPFARTLTLDEEHTLIKKTTHQKLSRLADDILRGEWYLTCVGEEELDCELQPLITLLSRTATNVEHAVDVRTPHERTEVFTTVPGKTNVELRFGNTLPFTPKDPVFVPLAFGIAVLGHVGGFSGRLMSTVREKEGLTYGIYASIVEGNVSDTCYWNIFTFFTARDLRKGMQAVERELTRIITKGITTRELTVFKEILTNKHILAHDSGARRLMLYHSASLRGKTEEAIKSTIERIQSLTVREVNSALKAHIDPKRIVIAGAGPVEDSGAPRTLN